MFRACVLAALLFTCAVAQAEEAVSLRVGDGEVVIALPADYLRASETAPAYFERSAAALPPAVRLVESLVAASDLKGMLIGRGLEHPYVQLQVMRDAEAIDLTAADWKELQPTFARQFGALDLTSTSRALQAGASKRMSDASGTEVEVRFGDVGKPRVYSQADGVVRYTIRIPVSGSVGGQSVDMLLDCAGAALVLNGKLMLINVYGKANDGDQDYARVRAMLEDVVTRARALNEAPTA